MNKVITILIFIFLIQSITIAMERKNLVKQSDCVVLCNLFMDKIVKEDIEEAFSFMQSYFPSDPYINNVIQSGKLNIINALNSTIKPRYGEPIGYKLVSQKEIEDTVLQLVYVEKFERFLIRWIFIFYKPDKVWHLGTIHMDENIFLLFQ